MQAARELFSRQGFAGTTIKDIVEKAGVNVSLVSYHFHGKEGLFQACLEEFGQEKLASAHRILQAPTSAEELRVRLHMFATEILEGFVKDSDLVRMIQREAECADPRFCEVFESTFLQVFKTLVAFIESAQEVGVIRKELVATETAGIFFGALTHSTRTDELNQRYFGQSLKDEAYRKRFIDQLIAVILHGVVDGSSKTE